MPNTWKKPAFPPLDTMLGDGERDRAISRFPVLDAGIHSEDGPIMVIYGIGHDAHELAQYAVVDDAHGGWWTPEESDRHAVIEVTDGHWMWTPAIVHCEPYAGGWCDDDGVRSHRHIVQHAGGVPLTLLTLMLWAEGSGEAETYRHWWERTHPDVPFSR